jgi:hypothetical protein
VRSWSPSVVDEQIAWCARLVVELSEGTAEQGVPKPRLGRRAEPNPPQRADAGLGTNNGRAKEPSIAMQLKLPDGTSDSLSVAISNSVRDGGAKQSPSGTRRPILLGPYKVGSRPQIRSSTKRCARMMVRSMRPAATSSHNSCPKSTSRQ